MKSSYIIHNDWVEAIRELPQKYQFECFNALFDFVANLKIPENISKVARALMVAFRYSVENDNKNYVEKIEKNKCGAPKGNQNARKNKSFNKKVNAQCNKSFAGQKANSQTDSFTNKNLSENTKTNSILSQNSVTDNSIDKSTQYVEHSNSADIFSGENSNKINNTNQNISGENVKSDMLNQNKTENQNLVTGSSTENIENNSANETVAEIINHLNKKTNANFAMNETNIQLINDKLKSYSVSDLKSVIDKKCNQWLHTEYQKYLRPQTLFSDKFDSYLNEPVFEKNPYSQSKLKINHYTQEEINKMFDNLDEIEI